MGCGTSREIQVSAQPGATHPNRPVPLQRTNVPPPRASRSPQQRSQRNMSARIRTEFLAAVDAAFGNMEYGIIGGAALAEYGNPRGTPDVDVIVPQEISLVVEGHLLSRGMVRTAGGGLEYVAFDGQCYGLDFTADRDINQRFRASRDTQRLGGGHARVVKIDYLLNSKGHAYLTWVGDDRRAKMALDAEDILFIIQYMRRHSVAAQQSECRWVTDYDFWTMFCSNYQGTEQGLRALGLRRDATPSSSNRQSRNTSMSIHSRNSSGTRSGGSRGH